LCSLSSPLFSIQQQSLFVNDYEKNTVQCSR